MLRNIGWCGVVLAVAGIAGGQTLTVVSAMPGGTAGPLIRTQMAIVTVTGFEPLRPITLFVGQGTTSIMVPGFAGTLQMNPAPLAAFGPFDGLGVFGGSFAVTTDAAGGLSFPVIVPANFGAPLALPVSFRLQAVALQNPSGSGLQFRFSNAVTVTIVEPSTPITISGLSSQTFQEGGATPLKIFGSFLPNATVVPQVRFISTCNPGAFALGTNVQLVDDDPGVGITPVILVTPPPFIAAPTAPSSTSSGLVLVSVRYSATTLYPNNPTNGDTVTAPSGFADPTYLAYQTSFVPAVTGLSPKAGTLVPACPVTITGTDFLNCAEVRFGGVLATGVVVQNATTIVCNPPTLAQGLADVVVRNPDHVPALPKESATVAGVTDYAVFNYNPAAIAVNGISPPTLVEGTATTITITGTCPQVGGYTALDPRSGTIGCNLGSNILGTDSSVSLSGISVAVGPVPGNFTITATARALPPGLNPTALTAAGKSNTGPKHVQIISPLCLDPLQIPHATFTAIQATKPLNVITYLAQAAPAITSITPNNCGRVDGGQAITINGTGFFTVGMVLPASNPALIPFAEFLTAPATPLASVTIVDEFTITAVTPDSSALALPLPAIVSTRVTNPDTQASATAATSDDFNVFPSLSGTVANTFVTAPGTLLLNTGTPGAPQVFTFTSDVVIPATQIINADGTHPLIIRCRGDVTIDGTINLSGDTINAGTFLYPAGGARGGDRSNAGNLGTQDPFQGLFGSSPFDPVTAGPYNGFGQGGFHAVPDGGGGGGGAFFIGGTNGALSGANGGPGGLAYGFITLPIPVLGSGPLGEFDYPPGGSGAGAGGMGTPPPFNPSAPPAPATIGFAGAGGRGGGAVCIAADGRIILNGVILTAGEPGEAGSIAAGGPETGGGGGGGAGGGILLQALRGIAINGTASLLATPGLGGPGGNAPMNNGGSGSSGMIRAAIPAPSANPGLVLVINGGALTNPPVDTTAY